MALLAYLATVLLYPALHQRHHALHGDDHVHLDLSTIYFTDKAPLDERPVEYRHNDVDADFAALELTDVAEAGAQAVDCSLSRYTLTDCNEVPGQHPHRFGDELLAHAKHHPSHTPDLQHGLGSLEHLGTTFIAAQPHTLPPPPRLQTYAAPIVLFTFHSCTARITRDSRGPPPSV